MADQGWVILIAAITIWAWIVLWPTPTRSAALAELLAAAVWVPAVPALSSACAISTW